MTSKQRRAEQRRAAIERAAKKPDPAAIATQAFGLDGAVAMDAFSNLAARMGYGSSSVSEGAEYSMIRWTNDYWLMLTLYCNHWLARRTIDNPAKDIVKSWPRLISSLDTEDIQILARTIQHTRSKAAFRKALGWGDLFGGGGALMVIDGHEDILDEPLDLEDVNPGSYKGLIPFDRWSGIQPGTEIAQDINRPIDFGLPEWYQVNNESGASFKVHSSRILRFTGPEVPNPEFQARLRWGVSRLEIVFESLRKLDNCSWSILNLLFRAQILAQKNPDLAGMLSGANMTAASLQRFQRSMQAQNELLSNQSMLVLGKDAELFNTTYSFSGLSDVFQQFQLDYAGAAEQPVVRLFGRTIGGLNNTGEGDEKLYEERISGECEDRARPNQEKLYPVIMMSEFGDVAEDFDFTYPSIRVLTEKEKAEIAKATEEVVGAAYQNGGITMRQYVRELHTMSRTTGIMTSIDEADIDRAPNKYIWEVDPGGGGLTGPNGDLDEGSGDGGSDDESEEDDE